MDNTQQKNTLPKYLSRIPFPGEGNNGRSFSTQSSVLTRHIEQRADEHVKRNIAEALKLTQDIELHLDQQHPFLQEYVAAARQLTDAKPQTLITTLLPILASNVGNKAYVKIGIKKNYINVWSITIAPSTIGRKSTSLNIAASALKAIDHELYKDWKEETDTSHDDTPLPYAIYPDATLERFVQILEYTPSAVLIHFEIADFFSQLERSQTGGYKAKMVKWFDGDGGRIETKRRDTHILIIRRFRLPLRQPKAGSWISSMLNSIHSPAFCNAF